MAFLFILACFALVGVAAYMVLDALLPRDPDLERARGGRSSETSCGIPGCAAHRIVR